MTTPTAELIELIARLREAYIGGPGLAAADALAAMEGEVARLRVDVTNLRSYISDLTSEAPEAVCLCCGEKGEYGARSNDCHRWYVCKGCIALLAERDALQARVRELEGEFENAKGHWTDDMCRLRAERDALRAEVARMKDAEANDAIFTAGLKAQVAGLRAFANLVINIPKMTDEQLEQLRLNAKAAIDGESKP
jgi:hypothetical protein